MKDRRKSVPDIARTAAWACDIALMRLERVRADNRLPEHRAQVDHYLRDTAEALVRSLHRLGYGQVRADRLRPAPLAATRFRHRPRHPTQSWR